MRRLLSNPRRTRWCLSGIFSIMMMLTSHLGLASNGIEPTGNLAGEPASDVSTRVSMATSDPRAPKATEETRISSPFEPHSEQAARAIERYAVSLQVGDPVLPHTGEMTLARTLYSLPSATLAFDFKIAYRSGVQYDGPLGYGFEHNWNGRFRDGPGSTGNLTYFGMGRSDIYQANSQLPNTFKILPGEGELSVVRLLQAGQNPKVIVTFDDGRTETYEKIPGSNDYYFLTAVRGRVASNAILIGYDAQGRTSTITDTLQIAHKFSYDSNSRIISIEQWHPGSTASDRTFAFTYQGQCLATIDEPMVGTESRTTRFTYAPGVSSPCLLTAVTAPNQVAMGGGPYLTVTYDAQDRVTLQTFGSSSQIIRLQYGTNSVTEFDRMNNQRVFSLDPSTHAVTQVQRQLGGSFKSTRVSWNASKLISQFIYPEGNGQINLYNARGQLVATARSNAAGLNATSVAQMRAGSNHLVTEYVYLTNSSWSQISRVIDAKGKTWSFLYDAPGNLVRLVTPSPEIGDTQFAYDSSGRIATVTDGAGRLTAVSYGAQGLPSTIVQDPAASGLNLRTTLTHDARGNITQIQDPAGNTWSYAFNEQDEVIRATTPDLYNTLLSRDRNGNLVELRRDSGNPDANEPQTKVTWNYDVLDLAVEFREYWGVGHSQSKAYAFEYDAMDRMTTVTYPRGNKLNHTYNEWGLVTSTRFAFGTTDMVVMYQEYDSNGRLTVTRDAEGNETSLSYDAFSRIIRHTDGEGHYQVKTYDKNSNLTQIDSYTSGASLVGRVTSTFNADNLVVSKSAWARLSDLSTPIGSGQIVSTITYDPSGKVTSVSDPCGCGGPVLTTYVYDAVGRTIAMIDERGNRTDYGYDPRGLVSRITTSELEAATPRILITEYDHDVSGRVIQVRELGDGSASLRVTSVLPDASGSPHTVIDPNGSVLRLVRDDLQRLVRLESQLDPTGVVVVDRRMEYDANNNVTKVIMARGLAPDQEVGFSYNNLDAIASWTDESGQTESFTYNTRGLVSSVLMRSGTVATLAYDRRMMLAERRFSLAPGVLGPSVEQFQHDSLGRLTKHYNEDVLVTMKYTTLGEIEEEKTWIKPQDISGTGSTPRTMSYTFDSNGLEEDMLLSGTDMIVRRKRDSMQRVSEIQLSNGGPFATLAGFQYSGPGRVSSMTYGNGVVTTWGYDGFGQRSSVLAQRPVAGSMVSMFQVSRGHDAAGRVAWERRDHHDNAGSVLSGARDFGSRYYYDAANRLVKAIDGVGFHSGSHTAVQSASETTLDFTQRSRFDEDEAGNWKNVWYDDSDGTNVTVAARYEDRQHNSENELSSLNKYVWNPVTNTHDLTSTTTYAYDARGGLTTGGIQRDADGRVRRLGNIEYSYDTVGRLFQKIDVATGSGTRFYYDGLEAVADFAVASPQGKASEADLPTWYRVYGRQHLDQLIFGRYAPQGSAASDYYFHQDLRHSVVMVTTAPVAQNPVIQEGYRYDVYGGTTIVDANGTTLSASTIAQDYRFTGRRWDADLGMYDLRNRNYSPELGRFDSRDPAADDAFHNDYAYVGSDPVAHIDPRGLTQQAPCRKVQNAGESLDDWCARMTNGERPIMDRACAKAAYDACKAGEEDAWQDYRNKVAEAKRDRENAQKEYRDALRQAENDFRDAQAALRSANRDLQAAQAALHSARLSQGAGGVGILGGIAATIVVIASGGTLTPVVVVALAGGALEFGAGVGFYASGAAGETAARLGIQSANEAISAAFAAMERARASAKEAAERRNDKLRQANEKMREAKAKLTTALAGVRSRFVQDMLNCCKPRPEKKVPVPTTGGEEGGKKKDK